jgi:superfamily II DNA or RNA helicase/IS1 family transposase
MSTDWPHQTKALDVLKECQEKRAMISMACGTGKTRVMNKLTKYKFENNRIVMMILPNLPLLKQTAELFDLPDDIKKLVICSDDTIKCGKVTTDLNKIAKFLKVELIENDEASDEETEIEEEETDDLDLNEEFEIEPFDEVKTENNQKYMIFCSYQSMYKVRELFNCSDFRIDVLIADEAHRVANSTNYQWILGCKEINYRYFFTATVLDYMKESKELFGEILYNFTFKDAIEAGIITDYKIIISLFETPEYIENVNDPVKNECMIKSIKQILTRVKSKKIVSYHSFNECNKQTSTCSKDYHNQFIKLNENEINCMYIGSNVSNKKRNKILKDFENDNSKPQEIFNCRLLNEGVDIACIDTLIFVDPSNSTVMNVQRTGRCLRKYPNKEKGIIIIPVYVKNLTSDNDMYRFKPVLNLLKTLGTQDNRILEYLNGAENGLIEFDATNVETKIDLCNIKTKLHKFSSDGNWMYKYELLKQYVNINKKIPPKGTEYKGIKLEIFVTTQRKAYKGKDNRKITQDQINLLEQVPGWQFEIVNPDQWNINYELLKEYTTLNKKIPTRKTEYKNVKIGLWCAKQRMAYKGQGNRKITQKQIDLLNKIPGWMWDVYTDQWNINYELIKEYVSLNKKIPTFKTEYMNVKLGRWCDHQRQTYKSKGKITQQQINLLEEISGWYWIFRESLEVSRQKRITTSTESTITTKTRGGNQTKFRNNALIRFDNKCLITETSQTETLEAAHIVSNSDSKTAEDSYNDNAILLRSDLHKLFDKYLFSINPETMKVERVNDLDPYYDKLLSKKIKFKFNQKELTNLKVHYDKFNEQFE